MKISTKIASLVNYCFFTLLLSMTWSCSDDLGYTSNVINISKEVVIGLNQKVDATGPKLYLTFSVADSIDCINSDLNVNLNTDNAGTLKLDVVGVDIKGDCLHGKSKPYTEKLFDTKQPFHNFIILLKNSIRNEGKIIKSEKSAELVTSSQNGIILDKTQINLIEDNTVWGFCKSNDAKEIEEFTTFIQSQMPDGNALPKGYFGLFDVINDSFAVIHDDQLSSTKPYSKSHGFAIKYTNWDDFTKVMNQYKNDHPDIELMYRDYQDKK